LLRRHFRSGGATTIEGATLLVGHLTRNNVQQLEPPTQAAALQLVSRSPSWQARPVLICLSYLRWDFACSGRIT
jgi:hypothetical protein